MSIFDDFAYFSNTCSGWMLYNLHKDELPQNQYNVPFIGSIIVNDLQFLDFAENFDKYVNGSLTFGKPNPRSTYALQTKQNGWYPHKTVAKGYPVTYLNGSIETHWLHETSQKEVEEKFQRRLKRFRDSGITPIFIWAQSEFINLHNQKEEDEIITRFLNIKSPCIFLTKNNPKKYHNKFTTLPFHYNTL